MHTCVVEMNVAWMAHLKHHPSLQDDAIIPKHKYIDNDLQKTVGVIENCLVHGSTQLGKLVQFFHEKTKGIRPDQGQAVV